MKHRFLLLVFLPLFTSAQNYVDIAYLGYSSTFNNEFEGSTEGTSIGVLEAGLTYPVVLNEKHALITGFDFNHTQLELAPNAPGTDLFTTNLKIGLSSTYNEKWSSTLVLLPKLASDYEVLSSKDIYIGGFAILKLKKRDNLLYRFGFYGSTEAFGFFSTPIFGWYYLSDNERFEMDISLPIAGNVNYRLGAITVGFDYFGIGRSYNLTRSSDPAIYVQNTSLEFASYVQTGLLNNSVLLRGKLGFTTNDYEVYQQGEKIDFGLSAFRFGDDRTQLNANVNSGLFLKFEAIYRFQLPEKTQ